MRHIPRSVTLRIAFAVSALMCAADSVIAQAYPVKPVRVIFPFPRAGRRICSAVQSRKNFPTRPDSSSSLTHDPAQVATSGSSSQRKRRPMVTRLS